MDQLSGADRAKIEKLSALMMETISTDTTNPTDYVNMHGVSAKLIAHCSTRLTSQNPFNSKLQLIPYDKNRNNDIDRLSSELMQNVLSYLMNRDLSSVDQVSRSWHFAVQILKKHHNAMVQNKYALENSYFGSREVNGWLTVGHGTALHVIKYAPLNSISYRDYVHFLAAYRAEYQKLCSIVLMFVRAARPGLHLNRDALYRVLL